MWRKGQLVLNTTGRIPASWDASKKVSAWAAAVGLGQSDGPSLCSAHHPTRVGGLILRLTFPVRATTNPFLPPWIKTTAPQ